MLVLSVETWKVSTPSSAPYRPFVLTTASGNIGHAGPLHNWISERALAPKCKMGHRQPPIPKWDSLLELAMWSVILFVLIALVVGILLPLSNNKDEYGRSQKINDGDG